MGPNAKTSLKYADGLAFEVTLGNHTFLVDSPNAAFGGQDRGPSPKSLLLPALGGCTAMDVTSILKKMKVPFTSLQVDVSGDLNDEHPIHFTRMHIKYIVRGKDIAEAKVQRAVELSQNTYCGVAAMLKKASEITYEIVIEEEG